MKRKTVFLISTLIAFALCLSGCFLSGYTDEVVASLGKYSDKEYYTCGTFQDYTDYAKYKYEAPQLEGNAYLKPINEENLAELMLYIENFKSAVDAHDEENEIVKGYDFNISLITEDDYVYIDDRSVSDEFYDKFDNYNVYFFDTGTSTLYYFHNNI